MPFFMRLASLVLLATGLFSFGANPGRPTSPPVSMPRYQHFFVIAEENHEYGQIIGNPVAPMLNSLARTYGLATNYYGVIHPSEGNYVALLGGSSYRITNDNPYYTHTIAQPSLANQLEGARLTWKGYFQSMPSAGFKGTCYPATCGGTSDIDPLYVSKHNGFLNFASIQNNQAELLKLVPIWQLNSDLLTGQVPNFSLIVPDQCYDMHGAPPQCPDAGLPGSPSDNFLVNQADTYAGILVNWITSSPLWMRGNNAIVITWDEGSTALGCCAANPGGGHVATIVITSHGPRAKLDSTSYNHYSLLLTIERAFGVGCLQFTCQTANVRTMTPLFT